MRAALTRFLDDPAACRRPGNPVLRELIEAWGNPHWVAREEFVAACVDHALSAGGPILECGSGLTTLLVGAVAARRGLAHWALEHKPDWAEKTRRALRDNGLEAVVLRECPLVDRGDYAWYDPPPDGMPDRFSLVVCDGPPDSTKGGRSGLVPVMRRRFAPGCVVLLDDAIRPGEREIALRWKDELGSSHEILGSARPWVRLQLPG